MARAETVIPNPLSRGSASIAIAVTLLAMANLVLGFPGVSGPDSQDQYAQAVAGQFDDWHPPIMAWLWSVFRLIADGDGPMFCFQVVCYWLGFGLIAMALARAGRLLAASAMLGVALLPPLLTLNVLILKDVSMGVTFLLAFALLFWYRTQNRKAPPAIAATAGLLLFYGALVRTNAVFALVPLLAYAIRPQWLRRPFGLLAIAIPVSLALVPAASLFNHRALQAKSLGTIRSLQIFDLAGISAFSGDLAVFGPDSSFTRDEVTTCYTPTYWDSLAPWGECRFFWNRLAVSPALKETINSLDAKSAMVAEPNPDLPELWTTAIVRHPLAYVRHRLAHFSSEIWHGAATTTPIATAPKSLGVALYDFVTAPIVWLAIGAAWLIRLAFARSIVRTASNDAAVALLLSGLSYGGAYLIVGVGTELRYFFWSLIAIFTALIISLSQPVQAIPPSMFRRVDRGHIGPR
jgi:hypothetical protein